MKQRDVRDGARTMSPELRSNERDAGETIVDAIDVGLLDRVAMQWQFGDWDTLMALPLGEIAGHPDRARIALFVAAAQLQRGDVDRARQLVRESLRWGSDRRLVARLLIAGVHNKLGRAGALLGLEGARVERHFRLAVQGGGGDGRLAAQARLSNELGRVGEAALLGRRDAWPAFGRGEQDGRLAWSARHDDRPEAPRARTLAVRRLAQVDLGLAWAANSVNTVIFRHHAILCDGEYQFTAVYVDAATMRLCRRSLIDGSVQFSVLEGSFNLTDAHNSISLGIDRAGYVHLCYDHHGTALRYRRSLLPHDISRWSDELAMTGAHEGRVTYPTFVLAGDGQGGRRAMLFMYRDGKWNKGVARFKQYDEATRQWADFELPVLSGADEHPWSCNAYWNHPAGDRRGGLHLSFVWRTHALGVEGRVNNINIAYAQSADGGVTWQTVRGQPYRLPITPVNAETACAISPGSNLMNQCSMAADSHCHPHVAYYANDDDGIPQYQHLWFDGRRWNNTVVSRREVRFDIEGAGTLPLPLSRPEVLVDDDDNVFVIHRSDVSHNRLVATCLLAPAYDPAASSTVVLWDEDVGFAEPIIDRTRWERERILTMLIQHNRQPLGDGAAVSTADSEPSPCRLIDFRLEVAP